jgi:hypothetical protein
MNFLKLLPVFILLFSSCKKENRCDCIKRTGEIVVETRSVPAFDRIFAEQDVDVFISQDVVSEVKVEAGENIVPLIETIVEDGILIIRNKNRCNWARSYKKPLNVYIKTPGLTYIHSNGSGNIKSLNTITVDSFDIQIEGAGDIELTVNNNKVLSHVYGIGNLTLRGNANEHLCSIGGSSFLYASELNTGYTYLHSYTLGLSYIKTTGMLIYRIDDKGDVYCYGNPSAIQEAGRNGTGILHVQ